MARRTKDAPGQSAKGGRTTPKRGRVTPKATSGTAERGTGGTRYAREATGRYTPPIPSGVRSSPWWVPTIMLAFFALGLLSIVLNYLGVLPSAPSNDYLLGGLGLIVLGFITATRWH